jgi:PAS domain S-box-containing protein
MNILIVDDNATNLKLLQAQLEGESHAVFKAHDGAEALAVLERGKIDAVITDILMPRMDGYRLCHEIRGNQLLHDLPVIVYTATYTSPSDEKLAMDVGADQYLKKPASVETLVASLREATARSRAKPRAEAIKGVEVLNEYSECLVAKLEEKNLALEQANAELRATRNQLAHLLEHSPAVIYSLKVDGERVIPRVVSENITRLLGFTVKESCSYDWWVTHLHPEDREREIVGISETIKHGVFKTEYRVRHNNGHYRWVEDSRRLVRDAEGKPAEIVGVWADVTELKQTQKQMLRAQRLESIGTLAGGVAHDLNNALAPIMIITELLRQDVPSEAAQNLDLIMASTKRAADMVKQLLTFAKGAEGERLLVQPHILIKEMEKMIKVSFPKSIELNINCPKDLPPVLGDATQIHQVLLNLCVNARDAMPEGGTLTLKAENIQLATSPSGTVGEFKPGPYVACSVMDTGTGIPPEILDHIFDPFFTTKPSDKGTGLGLSTVLGIVKSHGGFLQVSSTPGEGSTFTFFVPPVKTGDPDLVSPAGFTGTFHGNGDLVLVVDDEAPLRKLLRTVLTKLNFKVITAADGTDALVQAAEQRAGLRLVITDIDMPHMDGLKFIRALKSRLPNVKIIVTSGKTDESMAEEFNKLGIESILDKPFRPASLVAILKEIFAP